MIKCERCIYLDPVQACERYEFAIEKIYEGLGIPKDLIEEDINEQT